MTDCFALLQEPRRPWLDPDALKQKFLSLSTQCHPDRVHAASEAERAEAQERYAELNAAYQRLRDPKERLQHLLELELGTRPQQVQRIPTGLMEVSIVVAQQCKQADAFIARKSQTVSPLLLVQLFEPSQEWTTKLTDLLSQIQSRQNALTAELKNLDAEWDANKDAEGRRHTTALPRLEELWRLSSYYARWASQLQERIVQLSL